MLYYGFKTLVTLGLIIAAAEIAKRSTLIGGLVASVPIVSVLAMIWLYIDTQDTARIAAFASSIFWLVLPSLSLFITMPLLLRNGLGFWLSLIGSVVIMIVFYIIMLYLLENKTMSA